jgi:hypothetical protein
MSYTVTFTPTDPLNGNFAVFQDLDHAKEFIASRPDGYGKDFVIIDEDTGKPVK